MNFTTAVKACLQKQINFTDRASRLEFGHWLLFLSLSFLGLLILSAVTPFGETLGGLFVGFTFLPTIAVSERRRIDIKQSAYWRSRLEIHIMPAAQRA